MKLAIMQPYFFPYTGYFSLIKHTDRFILLDTVQFIRHGWIERNRMLKQDEGWLYIKVPIIKEKGRDTLIKDSLVDNTQNWKQKILSQLMLYKKIAPYYNEVTILLNDLFAIDYRDIVSLNKAALVKVCSYLEIDSHIDVFSEMNLSIDNPNAPDEWALNICKALGNVKEYWNPIGGMDFFDKQKFQESGLQLRFHKIESPLYQQHKRNTFEPDLSIIDVMMFNTVENIVNMLDNYQLI